MWCYLLKGLIDLSSGVNWLHRPNAEGPASWRCKVRTERSPEEARPCQSSVTETSESLGAGKSSFQHVWLCTHTDSLLIIMQEMLMKDGNELIDFGCCLIPSLSLSLFFIRLFQTLNVSLYNSSQPLQLPRVSGSSLGEETATYKGRSAPRPTIWRNSNHNKTLFKTEHVHSYTHFHSCT